MRVMALLSVVATTLVLASTARAVLLGYEGFAGYTVGSNLVGQSGSGNSGLAGTWSGAGHEAQATSLSYTNGGTLITSGGSLRSTANVNVFRDLTTPIPTTTTTGEEFWMAYLFKSGTTLVDDNLVRFYVKTDPGLNGTPNQNGRGVGVDARLAEIANPNPNEQLVATRLWFYQVIQTDSAPLFRPPGETNLLLLQYVLDDATTIGNQGVVRSWVNPVIGGAPPSIESAVAVKADLGAWPSPDRLGFFSLGSGDSAVTWDELRWGRSFADVTPVAAPPQPGDYNGDGQVNQLDHDTWITDFGQSVARSDGNANGSVDAADYNVWRDNISAPAGAASVPEPCTIFLLAFGGLLTLHRRA